MKTNLIFLLLTFLFAMNVNGQQPAKDKIYSIGIGFGNENNVSNYGILFTNDLKLELLNRFYLNPRVGFFQSTGSLEHADQFGYRSHSGLFLDCGISYAFVKKQNFEITLNAGPSYEIGSETFLRSASIHNDEFINVVYENNQLSRLGAYADIEFSWMIKNVVNTIGIKTNAYGFYPEYVGIIYKIGLKK
jgi:hypothetical protein